jgi:hypothetical protein
MIWDATRREALFYAAGAAGTLALAAGTGASHGQSERPVPSTQKGQMTMTGHDMTACIDECGKCHRVCVETLRYCLEKGGRYAASNHILLLIDCAEICQTNANFMLRGSVVHRTICGACADTCERCAESCESIGDDAQLKACAKTCRDCAQSCRNMAKG